MKLSVGRPDARCGCCPARAAQVMAALRGEFTGRRRPAWLAGQAGPPGTGHGVRSGSGGQAGQARSSKG
jgi:hypothetical protein